MDFQSWLRQATGALSDSESPKRDAEILLEYVTGKPARICWPSVKPN
ncbi:N5-glutamine S-adenosyl-L-methionine-dependent methyltransferase [Enterobacter cloacae]|uniref:N5-glutamine S-adenosyl-L-methionine-dependent methyltransferase n=1 Tax=Enterobacter cloacae TaxID=550 RepID=A0A377LXY5_ENTCL|nr:N5-glutamine S-adenosyl-L-methionine-dependent methyltransferase [Enterobacter cloacae]